MTLDHFWLQIETAIMECDSCDICPVQEYAKETNTERMCDKVCDCADGLMMLHRKLQNEEHQMMERENNDVGRVHSVSRKRVLRAKAKVEKGKADITVSD